MGFFAQLAFGIGLLAMFVSSAYGMDGNEFLKFCKILKDGTQKKEEAAYPYICLGYIRGFQDAHAMMAAFAADASRLTSKDRNARDKPFTPDELKRHSRFCIPEGASNAEQIARVVVLYLEAHPQDLHIPAGFLMMAALQEAFSCWKK